MAHEQAVHTQPTTRERAERAIASLLLSGQVNPAEVVSRMEPDVFDNERVGLIIGAARSLLDEGRAVCYESVRSAIEDDEGLADWLTPTWVVQQDDAMFLPSLLDEYKRIVLEHERFARFKQGAAAARTSEDLERVCTAAMEAHRIYAGDDELPIDEAVDRALERMDRIRKGDEVGGHSWGIPELDYHCRVVPGTLNVVAGSSKGGKSQFALNVVDEAIGRGEPCFIASLEMSTEANLGRLFARRTGIDSRRFYSPEITDAEWYRIQQEAERLRCAPLRINQFPALTAQDISARVSSWKRSAGVPSGHGIVVVDYLQLIPRKIERGQNDSTAIGDVCRTLRATAKRHKVAVIALTQFTKEGEGQRPHTRYIDGSQQIKATADSIVLLDLVRLRDSTVPEGPAEPFDIVVFQRNGGGGRRVSLDVDLSTNYFRGRGCP